MASSLYASEQTLLRLRNQLVHPLPQVISKEPANEEESDENDLFWAAARWSNRRLAVTTVTEVLQLLDGVVMDGTFDALRVLLSEGSPRGVAERTVVFTAFADTAGYLYSALSEISDDTYRLVTVMPFSARTNVTERFQTAGGLLITTDAATQGLHLGSLRTAIHYDEPSNSTGWDTRADRCFFEKAYLLRSSSHPLLSFSAPWGG